MRPSLPPSSSRARRVLRVLTRALSRTRRASSPALLSPPDGVHHDSSKAASSDDADHAAKAKTIVDTVLALMDTDADGFLTLAEFVRGSAKEGEEGLTGEMGGLPDFKGYDELGHHYDEESE